ncbi:MAG TPA: hypothetical protein VMA54_08505 [Steroidobacteraceae bacterium]|nr:hypothetical protein [Steroidobacteraceae bacterium]
MGHRIIPAALASVGFLVTFTVRSWHRDLWSPHPASSYATASATQQQAAARGTSIATPPPESQPPLASVMRQEAARLRALPTRAALPAVAPSARGYLAERDREMGHDGRLR